MSERLPRTARGRIPCQGRTIDTMHANPLRNVLLGCSALAACLLLAACGGGGGGAAPADVAGQVLVVNDASAPNPPATVTIGGASATTDASGYFVLRSVPSNASQITITATGFAKQVQPLPPLTPNVVNDLGPVFISADGANAAAKGRIVDVNTVAPVSGAIVILSGQRAVTGADGKFSFTGLPVGLGNQDYVVGVVKASGYPDKKITLNLPLGAPTATNPVNDLGDIAISNSVGPIPGAPTNISGTVTLQGQSSYAGVTVDLLQGSVTVATVTTAGDGKFGFWVPAGSYVVRASATGFQTQQKNVTLASQDKPQTVNFTLTP